MNLVLDWGGVIIDDPAEGLLKSLAEQMNLSVEVLRPWVTKMLPEVAQGFITEDQMFLDIIQEFNLNLNVVDYWYRAVQNVFCYRQAVLSKIQELRGRGWHIYLLSNTEPSAVKYLHEGPLYALLDQSFVSCEIGQVKPDMGIYEYVQDALGNGQIYFADDKAENLVPAMELGWKCYHVQSEHGLLQWLATLD